MQTLDYTKIQKIETSATKKLLNYISTVAEFKNLLEDIEFLYPNFDDTKNSIALSIWLSMDFITDSGKTFIAQFLDEKSAELTSQEKEILRERDKSNISLFEIIKIHDDNIQVLDLLQNKFYDLSDPELIYDLDIGDIIFSRMGNLLGQATFIGDLNYLPTATKYMFLKQAFVDFNYLRSEEPMLTMKDYLKNHSLNLYSIYTNCIFEAMEQEEDITSNLYDELDEFEAYLQLNTSGEAIRKSITILIEFFEYYLADENLTLYDLDTLDLNLFFIEAIGDGFISSHEGLHSYISTLKKYLGFLSHMNSEYKKAYKDILEISKNRFSYIKNFELVKPVFEIDQKFSNLVSNILNEEALSILTDLDRFLLYIIENPLELTRKNKHIKRQDLFDIRNILETGDFPNKKAPNQKDFPLIHLFFKLTTHLEILEIEDNTLISTRKADSYLRLRDKEKYALLFQYIWGLDKMSFNPEFLSEYYFHLQYFGILKSNLYPNYEVNLTNLGEEIIHFLESKDEKKSTCSIISLDTFKNSK